MADLQKYFRQFHDAIAVKRDQEKALLSEKRERIQRRLSEGIEQQRKDGTQIPAYSLVNQGSYAMGTGIKPKDGDYDLDVAVLFELDKKNQSDPVSVKEWVFKAVENHTARVEMRRPCVTVYYQAEGEPIYHVDLAIYAAANADGKTYLALGKRESKAELRKWEESDPQRLVGTVNGKFTDAEDGKQFRRNIRYLKRWRDENFPKEGHAAPRGIALTACALKWFTIHKLSYGGQTTYDDHGALKSLVRTMLASFSKVFDSESGTWIDRLSVALPVPPGNDLFERMTNAQMVAFHEKLEKLSDALEQAKRDPDPSSAAATLQKHFGDEFPVPPKESTASKRSPAITSSGNSG
jgi:hypothetical protein